MPYCNKCGSFVNEADKYCGKCGTPQTGVLYANGLLPIKLPPKSSTNFSNGFGMGIGVTLVVAGLLWLYWLNNNYWQTQAQLLAAGFPLKEANYLLLDNVFLISFCIVAILIGGYLLIYTTLVQFSPTMNSLLHNGLNRARWGIALITGGMISLINVTSDFALIIYQNRSSFPFAPYFAVAGLLLIITGLLLLVNAYLKTPKLATKV